MITKDELIDFIESFKKQPGQYTKDEIYLIGRAFKSLEFKKDKSWHWLKDKVGWTGSPDSLRCYINRRFKSNPDFNINDCETGSSNEVLTEEQKELYKTKTQIRDSYNAYRRSMRDEARIEDLKQAIIEAADKLAKLPPVEFKSTWKELKETSESNNEAVLCLSDLHIGVDCDNYYNTYNKDVAISRVEKLVNEVIKRCRENKVKTLHVLNLGDMIHGIIHTNARLESQLDVADQVVVAAQIVAHALNLLQEAAPEITYRSVFDNHSRAVADKNEHIEKEQFSKVIDFIIKQMLNNSASHVRFMNDNIDGGVGKFNLRNGKTIMFAHGHQDNINTSWQNFIGLTREWVDYIILAHYHNAKEKSYNGSIVFVNGSIVGTEQYAFGRRLFSDPFQKLIIFEPNSNTYNDINISLK